MSPVRRAIVAALIASSLPVVALRAQTHAKPNHAVLHPTASFRHSTGFMHVMASAKLRYTAHDVFVKLTADNLPASSSIGAKAYVLFASDGAMTDRVGILKIHGNMAGVTGQVMMTRVQDLYVYAEPRPNMKRFNGKEVLAGMIG